MEDNRLDQIYKLTKENNEMLHAMRRTALIWTLVRIAFWLIAVVGVPYVAWLYISPYVQQAQHTYQSVNAKGQEISNSPIAKFFEQFGKSSTSSKSK